MLVLTRNKGEQILVPGLGVAIKVVAVHGNTIRLGIAAPADVRVRRAELGPAGDDTTSTPAAPDLPQSGAAADLPAGSHVPLSPTRPGPRPPVPVPPRV